MAVNSLFFGNVGQFYGGYCTSVPKNAGYYFWNGTRWFRGSRGSDGKCAGYGITLSQVPTQVLAAKSRELERFVGIQTSVASHYPGGNEPAAQANIANYAATAYPNTIAGWDSNANYHRTLSIGKKGADVAWVQSKLGARPVDGDYGGITKAAVVTFQRNNDLTADGIFGPKSACKLGMPGAPNCGGTTPAASPPTGGTTSGGTTGTGGGGNAVATPPPPPKPPPPYKLPKYQPPTTGEISMLPYQMSDLNVAMYDIFNAYELALVSYNRYFETIQPSYAVISNMTTAVRAMDPTKSIIDSLVIDNTLAHNIDEILQTYAYGILRQTGLNDKKRLYSANKSAGTEKLLNTRAIGARFISNDTLLDIGNSKYKVSVIRRRMGQQLSAMNLPLSLHAQEVTTNAIRLGWATSPNIQSFRLTQTRTNGSPSSTVVTLPGTTMNWDSGNVYTANTQQCYELEARQTVYNSEGQPVEFTVGRDSLCINTLVTPPIPPPEPIPNPAVWTHSRPIYGQWYTRWAPPAQQDNFAGVHIVVNQQRDPQSPADGTVVRRTAAQAGQDTVLVNIGVGDRPDQTWYARMWSYNNEDKLSSTSSPLNVFFLRNPVEVMPSGRRAWQLAYGKWEPSEQRVRASNYGAWSNYAGIWWYDGRLQNAIGGRTSTSIYLEVYRKDGGSGGAIPAYIGNHNYYTLPASQPGIANVAQTPEQVARQSSAWLNMSRFNAHATTGQLIGFGMYKDQSSINDLHTWVGRSDVAADGRVHIRHSDFAGW